MAGESGQTPAVVTENRRAALPKYLGAPIKRREDPRLVTGQGSYVEDVTLPGMAHLALLRSPHGHARIASVDLTAARAATGVLAVVTNAELEGRLGPLPTDAGPKEYQEKQSPIRHPLAREKVRYAGEPVAA